MNERECPALGTNMRAMAILGLRKYIILLHKNNEKVLEWLLYRFGLDKVRRNGSITSCN